MQAIESWIRADPRVGLVQEPFVAGADTMIDQVVANLPDADHGFILIFSSTPFPEHQYRLNWQRARRRQLALRAGARHGRLALPRSASVLS